MTRRARSRPAIKLLGAAALVFFTVQWRSPARTEAKPELVLKKGDRIILIGNTLAERMQYYGHFETLLARPLSRARAGGPQPGLVGRRADLRPRQAHFNDHGHTLKDEKPDVLIAAFGFNESFAGPAGLAKFKKDLERFINDSTTTKYNGKAAPRLVLLSPIAQEDLKNPHITDGKKNNENIKLYSRRHGRAGRRSTAWSSSTCSRPRKQLYESSDQPLTINGMHLSDDGYKRLAPDHRRRPSSARARRRSRPT